MHRQVSTETSIKQWNEHKNKKGIACDDTFLPAPTRGLEPRTL